MWPAFAGTTREKFSRRRRHKSAGCLPRWNQQDRGFPVPLPRNRHDLTANPLHRSAFSAGHGGTGFRKRALPLRQFDKDSSTHDSRQDSGMTKTKQDFDHEDVRASDIVMSLGGFWVLLGVIAYLAMVA
jgi:hypothetical protein